LVDIIIDNLPIIARTDEVDEKIFSFKLRKGLSAETSGGLLIAMDPNKAKDFMHELKQEFG